ncbi:uncharacterized protein SAPINGB_P003763 [Magnusiomyces paraingens]|uniref:2-oxoisovalerate dehydrogenase subunit alpha n=1 Tax=Magnusiomyces paraingens TaxID=2606893 RepID=A0A5E8BR40_9ASCO|nr:uncharacterized protein SAPINGB_P003763 [Saprochaete ingens]VVT53813.1 unnamed protein product [Saprochaete ingens]
MKAFFNTSSKVTRTLPKTSHTKIPQLVISHKYIHSTLSEKSASILSESHKTPDASSSPRINKGLDFPGITKTKFVKDMALNDPALLQPMEIYRLIDVDGTQFDKSYEVDVDKDLAIRMYREMHIIGILDNIMYEAQRQGRLSFYMVNAGEEASAIGSASALKPNDVIFSQYREAGAILHRGLTVKEFMSQLYANKNDHGHGRSMPVHYMSKTLRIQPISSPLATQIPHAAGAAYALKVLGEKSGVDPKSENEIDDGACVICYFGDGAASEGDFHAALNMAATLNCPVIFFCRNNGYAISTPTKEQYRGDGIASRGIGYGIETIRVDGNDLLAVRRVTQKAREVATRDKKPVLIEAMSYRISHHSTSDDSFAYRPKREVEDWKRKDNPVVRFRKWLELKNWWNEDEEAKLKVELKKSVLKEFSAGEKTLKPQIRNIFDDMYDTLPETLIEQRRELGEILDTYPDHFDLSHFEGGRQGLGDK